MFSRGVSNLRPYLWYVVFLLLLSWLALQLDFSIPFLISILLAVHWASWMGEFMSHQICGVFSIACLVTQSCLTVCDPKDCSPPGSSVHGDSPGMDTGVGCHVLLQGIFPTQGSNPGLSHCRQIFYCLSHQWSPFLALFQYFFLSHSCSSLLSSVSSTQSVSKRGLNHLQDERWGRLVQNADCWFLLQAYWISLWDWDPEK